MEFALNQGLPIRVNFALTQGPVFPLRRTEAKLSEDFTPPKEKGGVPKRKPPFMRCWIRTEPTLFVHQLLHQIDVLQRLELGALFIVHAS